MSRERDMFVAMSVALANFKPNDPDRLNLTVDEENDRTVTFSELVKYVDKKIAEFEKEGIEECQDEVSLAVLEVLSHDSFSSIPEIVNRLQGKYSKGKVQNRLTKLVNNKMVIRGEVTEIATGKTRKGYKIVG